MVQPVSSEARRNLISGVLPIVPMKPSRISMMRGDYAARPIQSTWARSTGTKARWISWRGSPFAAQPRALGSEPIKRQQGRAVLDRVGADLSHRFLEVQHHDLDILVLVGEAVNAARLAGIDAA